MLSADFHKQLFHPLTTFDSRRSNHGYSDNYWLNGHSYSDLKWIGFIHVAQRTIVDIRFFSTFFLTLCSYPLPNVIHAIQSIAYAFWWPYTIAESVKSVIADPVKVRTRLQNGIIVLERMKTLAQATGWFGVLIGGIHILTRWKEFEDNAEIGLALSFCLLTGLYGTFLAYVVFFPLSIKLQTRLDELRET